jgi:hypothetical protein
MSITTYTIITKIFRLITTTGIIKSKIITAITTALIIITTNN